MNETQRRFLRKLRDAQPVGLRRSLIPKSCSNLVQELTVCGAAEFRPSPAGRGVVLCVASKAAFQSFIAARLPQGLDVDAAAIEDRAAAVVMLADAKKMRRSVAEGIFIRSTKPDIQILSTDGKAVISVSDLTVSAGGGGMQLSAEKTWTFAGSVAIVENADVFWRYELVLPEIDLAVLSGGNMSARLINWLASQEMEACQITHWGDYDPVGVWQYCRLFNAGISRIDVYAPPEVDQLLPRYGKRRLVTGQTNYLDRLRRHTSDPYVERMVDLFDRHRRGLEQEILLHQSTLRAR